MEGNHLLQQSTSWDPLDLTNDVSPAHVRSANDRGEGILPDVDTRPEIRPVSRPLPASGNNDPAVPWG